MWHQQSCRQLQSETTAHLCRLAVVELQRQGGGLLLQAPDLSADGSQPVLIDDKEQCIRLFARKQPP